MTPEQQLQEALTSAPREEVKTMRKKTTTKDAALWMQEEIEQEGILHQEYAAQEIADRFGKRFVYRNRHGNPAIRRDVLGEFFALTKETVVWVRSERYWRERDDDDPEGRQV